jgi:predicted amidohydrolase
LLGVLPTGTACSHCSGDASANVANACKLVREAAARGANIILLQELFETPYFCQVGALARAS